MSHYLPVRLGEDDENLTSEEAMLQSVRDYYMLYALMAVAISILIAVIVRVVRSRKSGK